MRVFSIVELFSVVFLNFIIFTNHPVLLAFLNIFVLISTIVVAVLRHTFLDFIADTFVNCTVVMIDGFLLDCLIADYFAGVFVILVILQVDSLILFEAELVLLDQLRFVILYFTYVLYVGFVVFGSLL